jgi:hypothetical protein
LDALDYIAEWLAGFDIVDIQIAAFAATLGNGDGCLPSIEGRYVKVNRSVACRVELVGVEQHALGRAIIQRGQNYQQGLLQRRLPFDRKDSAGAYLQCAILR